MRTRGDQSFKRTEIKRAVRAATEAGLTVARVEIEPDGKFRLVIGEQAKQTAHDTGRNPWDEVLDAEDAKRSS